LEKSDMKKTLIALAALAATGAFAQSTVSIVGVVDVGYKNTSHTDATKSKTEIAVNNTATTALYFKGVEDLGGGLSASFMAEMDWNPAQSSTADATAAANGWQGTPFNGEQYVGLAGGFGSIKLGTPNAAGLTAGVTSQPFGTALGGGFSGGFGRMGTNANISGINQFIGNTGGRIIRHEKSVVYATPDFSGFKATAEYAFANENSTASVAGNTNGYAAFSLNYNKGPLNAVYAYTNEKAGGTNGAAGAGAVGALGAVALPVGTDVTWNQFAVNYNLGALTVYGGYDTTKQNGLATPTEDSSSWNLAFKYVASPSIELLGNFLSRDSNLALNADAKLIGLGANYLLSKRTNLYARYEGITFAATTAPGSVELKQNVYALGVKTTF
jgi:predicted porin